MVYDVLIYVVWAAFFFTIGYIGAAVGVYAWRRCKYRKQAEFERWVCLSYLERLEEELREMRPNMEKGIGSMIKILNTEAEAVKYNRDRIIPNMEKGDRVVRAIGYSGRVYTVAETDGAGRMRLEHTISKGNAMANAGWININLYRKIT